MLDARHERERGAVKRVSALIEPLRAATKSPSTDLAFIVKGLPNVVARAQAMIGSARRELVMLASDETFFRKLEADLVRANKRSEERRVGKEGGERCAGYQ